MLKQHTAIAESPTKTIETQANHMFASIIAYIKLRTIKLKHGGNHFAIKALIISAATKAAFLAVKQLLAYGQSVTTSDTSRDTEGRLYLHSLS